MTSTSPAKAMLFLSVVVTIPSKAFELAHIGIASGGAVCYSAYVVAGVGYTVTVVGVGADWATVIVGVGVCCRVVVVVDYVRGCVVDTAGVGWIISASAAVV